jgi:hypothetical protein
MERDGFVERKQATPVGWGKKTTVVEVPAAEDGTAVGGGRWESRWSF